MSLIILDYSDLALAWGLIAIAISLSAWQKLGLAGPIAIAAMRAFIQLIMVGYLLAIVFDPQARNPWLVLAVFLMMLMTASKVAVSRISAKMPNLFPLVFLVLLITTSLTLSYLNFLILQPQPWYHPQYVIPLAGMILGNAMNSATIGGERLVSSVKNHRVEIETHLSLGATPQAAMSVYKKEAIKAAMISILNQMSVVGIVTLPGTMTGQLLSGINPLDAVSYQILIMLAIAFTDLLSSILITTILTQQFFNKNAQLVISNM